MDRCLFWMAPPGESIDELTSPEGSGKLRSPFGGVMIAASTLTAAACGLARWSLSMKRGAWCVLLLSPVLSSAIRAAEPSPLEAALSREIIGPRQSLLDVQDRIESRSAMPSAKSVAEWEKRFRRIRRDVLDHVVFRGEAAVWRDAKCEVEWLDTIAGGPGYRIKQVRYEALPGLWIPALLYEPEKSIGKVPVVLAVNGHDAQGQGGGLQANPLHQLAKRGMIVLNVEWFGMGQLQTPGFNHWSHESARPVRHERPGPVLPDMSRGLDVLLAHAERRPGAGLPSAACRAAAGRRISISSLDTRVTLANPVAGYSGFRVQVRITSRTSAIRSRRRATWPRSPITRI